MNGQTYKIFHLRGATCVALFLRLRVQLCNPQKKKSPHFLKGVVKMSFSKMLEILQERNEKKIVLIRLGMFYIATGRDAVLLHDKLNLKCTCFTDNVCKVGVPIIAIDKYIEKLDKTGYGYVIYNYNKDKSELTEVLTKAGRATRVTSKNLNCLTCKGISAYKDDEYMLALCNYYEKLSNEENEKTKIIKKDIK